MFFVVDSYAHEIEGEFQTRPQAKKLLHELEMETGITVWTIKEAKRRQEILQQWAKQESTEEYR